MAIDVERFRTLPAYETHSPLPAVVADMDALSAAAVKWRSYRRMMRWISGGLLAAGIISFMADQPLFGVLGIVGAIAGFIYAYRYARAVLTHQHRIDAVRSISSILASDTDTKAAVSVNLAFKEDRKLLHEEEWPVRRSGKQRFYADSWLSVEVPLLDGTTLNENIVDLIRERSYKNPRGKSKTKTRIHHSVSMRFVYPPELYGDLTRTGGVLKDPIRLPPSARLKGLKVSDSDIKLKATVTQTGELIRSCSMLALGAYRMLNFGRKVTSRRSAQ